MDDPRYPIGKFTYDRDATAQKRAAWIQEITVAPAALRKAVAGLTAAQLDTRYRDGGWTVRQVVHHLADSHVNSFVRFKLALTEETPQIKPYSQDAWVMLADAQGEISASLSILDGLHARWTALLLAMRPEDFSKTFVHPENGPTTLDRALQIYSWHGKHHTAHITALRIRSGW